MVDISKNKMEQNAKYIEINRELCKGCGICVAFCPKKVLELNEHEKAVNKKPDQCIYCGLCEQRCPDLAIELKNNDQNEKPESKVKKDEQ